MVGIGAGVGQVNQTSSIKSSTGLATYAHAHFFNTSFPHPYVCALTSYNDTKIAALWSLIAFLIVTDGI